MEKDNYEYELRNNNCAKHSLDLERTNKQSEEVSNERTVKKLYKNFMIKDYTQVMIMRMKS